MDAQEMLITFSRDPEETIRLNNWIFQIVQPYVKGRTMELGSGMGGISQIFVDNGISLHLSDEKEGNRVRLRELFHDNTKIRMIHDIDFLRPDFKTVYSSSIGVFDTVIAINISEHGFYNKTALDNAKHLLRIRGHFMTIAPAYAALFNSFGQDLEELKTVNISSTKKLLGDNFDLLKVRYFNLLPATEEGSFQPFGLATLAIFRKLAL